MMKTLLSIALPALLASCASHPPPSDHLASAIAATRGAEEAGARQVPRAALQLKLAEEQISTARKMMENGDHLRADYMTLRAYNDAELALALARENAAARRASQMETKAASPSIP